MNDTKVAYGREFVESVFADCGVPVHEWRRYTAMLSLDGRLEPCTFVRSSLEKCANPLDAAEIREHIRRFLEECRVPLLA